MGPRAPVTSPAMPTSRPGPVAGPVPAWTGITTCGPGSSPGFSKAGPHSRWPDAWHGRRDTLLSPMRASTASSTPNWPARRTTPGATIYPGPRPNEAGGAAEAAAPLLSSPSGVLWQNARHRPRTGALPAIGRPTSCSSVPTARPSWSSMSATLASSWPSAPPGKTAGPLANAIFRLLAPLPPPWRQTITFDNGTEFARHYHLHPLSIATFFCDTHSPWQKGGVENAIGRLRRTLPRKTDLAALPEHQFTALVQAYNNTPRKCLDYQSPAEIFWNSLLHFKCESTIQLAPE